MSALDLQTWRVYSAESSIDQGTVFNTIEQAQAFLVRVLHSAWWARHYPEFTAIEVTQRPWPPRHDWWGSHATRDREFEPTSWQIELAPPMLQSMVLLHELAHCVAPQFAGDRAQIRAGFPASSRRGHHDEVFTAVSSQLVAQFATGENATEMAAAYQHYGVPVMAEEDIREAIDTGREVEALVVRMESDRVSTQAAAEAEFVTRGGVLREPWVPRTWWGESLWLARDRNRLGEGGRLTQAALAERISPVEVCTRRVISRIEHLEQAPADLRTRRVCMAMVAVLGIDPIWARSAMGLVRWTCGVELDELRGVAPGWVALVEELNTAMALRPPRWQLEDDR